MKLENLIQEGIEVYFYFNPVAATQRGYHKYDSFLGRYDKKSIDEQIKILISFKERVKEIPFDYLTKEEKTDYKLFNSFIDSNLRTFLEMNSLQRMPAIYLYSILYGLYLLVIRDYLPLEERLLSIKNRLSEVKRVLEEGKNNIFKPPATFVKVAREVALGGLMFLKFFIPPLFEKSDLKEEVWKINDEAQEAVQSYIAFLDYLSAENDDFSIGKSLFNTILKEEHFLPYSSDELLDWGKEMLSYTQQEAEKICTMISPGKTVKEIIETLKEDHPTSENLLEVYREETKRAREFIMNKGLAIIPEGENLIIENTPIFARSFMPFAAYSAPPPLQNSLTGRFWVTPASGDGLKAHFYKKIPITVLHESYPGHHLQLATSNLHPSMIRKLFYSPLFSEGWAFYCEELMEEHGYINEPEHRLIRLKDQLWRAARIVLDVRLHTQGMTVEEAVQFLVDKAYLEPKEAEAEVKRYTFSPTQPLSYLTGKREIMLISKDYQAMKGNSFQLEEFHTKLLSVGTIPPALVREEIF